MDYAHIEGERTGKVSKIKTFKRERNGLRHDGGNDENRHINGNEEHE